MFIKNSMKEAYWFDGSSPQSPMSPHHALHIKQEKLGELTCWFPPRVLLTLLLVCSFIEDTTAWCFREVSVPATNVCGYYAYSSTDYTFLKKWGTLYLRGVSPSRDWVMNRFFLAADTAFTSCQFGVQVSLTDFVVFGVTKEFYWYRISDPSTNKYNLIHFDKIGVKQFWASYSDIDNVAVLEDLTNICYLDATNSNLYCFKFQTKRWSSALTGPGSLNPLYNVIKITPAYRDALIILTYDSTTGNKFLYFYFVNSDSMVVLDNVSGYSYLQPSQAQLSYDPLSNLAMVVPNNFAQRILYYHIDLTNIMIPTVDKKLEYSLSSPSNVIRCKFLMQSARIAYQVCSTTASENFLLFSVSNQPGMSLAVTLLSGTISQNVGRYFQVSNIPSNSNSYLVHSNLAGGILNIAGTPSFQKHDRELGTQSNLLKISNKANSFSYLDPETQLFNTYDYKQQVYISKDEQTLGPAPSFRKYTGGQSDNWVSYVQQPTSELVKSGYMFTRVLSQVAFSVSCGVKTIISIEYDVASNSNIIWGIATAGFSLFNPASNSTVLGVNYAIYKFDTSSGTCTVGEIVYSDGLLDSLRDNLVIKLFTASDGTNWAVLMSITEFTLSLNLWSTSVGNGGAVSSGMNRLILFTQAPPALRQLENLVYISSHDLWYFKDTKTIFFYNWTLPTTRQIGVFVESDFPLGPSVVTKMSDGTSYMFFPGIQKGEILGLSLDTKRFQVIDRKSLSDVYLVPVMDDAETDQIKVYTARGGYYEVYKQDNRCLVCHISCRTCFGELNTQCLSCFGNFTVSPSTGKCVITCPSNTFPDQNEFCLSCHPNCATCTRGTQFDCLSCPNLEYTLIRGICLKNCPSTQYFDVNLLACTNCNPRCLSCTGSSTTSCTACNSGFILDEATGFCKRICSIGQYLDSAGDVCRICVPACTSCFGGSVYECTSCNSPWTLVPALNYCQPTCGRGQYISGADCLPCVNPCISCTKIGFCLDCIVNYAFLGNGICKCPTEGFYTTPTLECLPCNDVCQTCTNGRVSGCTKCKIGYLYNPFAAANNPVCVQDCPGGTFQNSITSSCAQCDPTCATCTGSTPQSCTSCLPNTGLFQGQCYTTCPARYVLNSTIRACIACPTFCLECNPKKNDQCLVCDQIFLNQGSCVQKCPLQTYPVTINNVKQCTVCSPGCLICVEQGICIKCRSGSILFGALCVSSCPVGYNLAKDPGDPINQYCDRIKCQDLCDVCQDTIVCFQCKKFTENQLTQVVNTIGQCVPCNRTFGLEMIDGQCQEICGDYFLYKIPNTKTTHQCDDGNTIDGDGCSSTCQIENGYSCTRQYQLSKESIPIKDYCIEATKKSLARDIDNPQRFSYHLRFSRAVLLNQEQFQAMYNLVIIDENKKQFIIPQDLVNTDPKSFYITVNEKQFRNSLFGSLYILKKPGLTKPPLFKDEVDQDMSIDGLNCTFIYDKDKQASINSITGVSDQINNFMESGLGQSVLIVCSMNPVFFNMMVNVLQKFVYFRVLNMMYPDNVQLFFKIFGSAWSVNLGQTNYDPKAPPNKFDGLLGLTSADQAVPDRFKAVKLSGLFLKGSLPSLLVMGVVYAIAMITLMIEKRAQKYTVKKLRKKKMLALIFKVNAIARSKLVWSSIIRSNFMSYQNFTFSTFLNIATLSRSKYFTMFSSLLSFFGIAFILGNILFYVFLIRAEKGEGGKFDAKFDIFNGSRDHFVGQYYKIFKFLVKPTILAIVTCLFYTMPAVPVYSLFIVSVVEQLVIMVRPVYISMKDNFKVIFEGFFMTILTVFPLLFFNMDPKSEQASSLGMTMLGFIFFIIGSNLVMGVVMEKKTI